MRVVPPTMRTGRSDAALVAMFDAVLVLAPVSDSVTIIAEHGSLQTERLVGDRHAAKQWRQKKKKWSYDCVMCGLRPKWPPRALVETCCT